MQFVVSAVEILSQCVSLDLTDDIEYYISSDSHHHHIWDYLIFVEKSRMVLSILLL